MHARIHTKVKSIASWYAFGFAYYVLFSCFFGVLLSYQVTSAESGKEPG